MAKLPRVTAGTVISALEKSRLLAGAAEW